MDGKCIFCGKNIGSNTNEHILLNSLGGKLIYNGLICENCNNTFGVKIDSDLYEQLYPYASLLNIDRDRGKNKNISTNSVTDYFLTPGGVPKLKKSIIKEEIFDDGKKHITIESSDTKQAKQALQQIKKKYGDRIDNKSIVTQKKQEFLKEKIPFSYTISPKMFPSIIKSAIEFCKARTSIDINDIIYKFNNRNYRNCYYCFDDIVKIKYESVFHIIALFNFNKNLYCYISYFNIFGFLVKLDSNINIDVEELYVYDLLKDDVVDTSNFIIDKEVLSDFKFNNNLIKDNSEKIKNRIGNFIKLYQKKSMIDIINRIYDESVVEFKNKFGDNISEKDILNKFLEKIAPYFEYWIDE